MNRSNLKPGWKIVRFGDVVHQIKDRESDVEDCDLTEYVRGEHFEPGNLKLIGRSKLGDGQHGSAFHMRFRKGDVLYVSRNPQLRKAAVVDFDGICANTTYVCRADNENLLHELLPFVMQTEDFVEYTISHKRGSTNFYLNWSDIAPYEFALPPLGEQRRIAQLLSATDEIVNAYAASLASSYTLRSAIRKAEFDPARHKSRPLSTFCDDGAGIRIGPFGSQLHQSDYVAVGVPVVMPANMTDERIDTSEIAQIPEQKAQELGVHRIEPGDILLPRRGELDRRAYVEEKNRGWLCGTGSIRIRVNRAFSAKAVFHSLASSHVVRWLTGNAVGTTMPNLNSRIVGRIPVALPSIDRQIMVVDQLAELQRQIESLDARLAQAQESKAVFLKQALGENG